MQSKHQTPRPSRSDEGGSPRGGGSAEPEPKRIYVRSVYALNPGIPHYLDFPRGWE